MAENEDVASVGLVLVLNFGNESEGVGGEWVRKSGLPLNKVRLESESGAKVQLRLTAYYARRLLAVYTGGIARDYFLGINSGGPDAARIVEDGATSTPIRGILLPGGAATVDEISSQEDLESLGRVPHHAIADNIDMVESVHDAANFLAGEPLHV